jgi:predicted GIY-YIG superfamily endonuclease
MDQMLFYVYILRSESNPDRYYTGFTEDLSKRLKDHNYGKCPHSRKNRPWKLKNLIAFSNREKALEFERYLKSPSGRAFAKKRF